MKMSKRKWILLLSLLWSAAYGEIVIRETAATIEIENSAVRRVIACSSTGAAPITVRSVYLMQRKAELLPPNAAAPWFAFSVNNSIVSNTMPLWTYAGHTVDTLLNGGRGIRLAFTTHDGLKLTLVIQMFPGMTLWRERAELQAGNDGFALTKHLGRVYCVFPSYTIRSSGKEPVKTREIQLAVWNGGDTKRPNNRTAYDERTAETGWRTGRNLGQNYMYHPVKTGGTMVPGEQAGHRGQILLTHFAKRKMGWMILHEHDAPSQKADDYPVSIEHARTSNTVTLSVRIRNGAYVEGERLSQLRPFTTPWVTSGWYEGASMDEGEAFIWSFLDRWMCDNPHTRTPRFYYNTWGMQRDESARKKDVRSVLTQARIIEDIRLAAELNIESYVLDDGWQEHFGDWTPHPQRLPNGLRPVAEELSSRGIAFGIWLGCLAVDSSANVFREHPEWLIRDSLQQPIVGRWERHVFCLVSDYQARFLQVCERLIDEGVRYFKWDGLDYHPCSSPRHHHGDSSSTAQDRIDRHRYEMIRSMVELARTLRLYNSEVVIEVDATEPDRPIGPGFLREGKFFWINNGASWYGDRSPYRAKSMRTVAAVYGRLLPSGLLTYANYPHNHPTFAAQRYNANSSLIGGRGFWGDLSDMSAAERQSVGAAVRLAKRITPIIAGIRPEVIGQVGSSPEIYQAVDRQLAEGQVVAFSGAGGKFNYELDDIHTDSLLAVVHNAYSVSGSKVVIPFDFPQPDVSREAFLFGNRGTGVNIISSTSWLKDARLVERGVLHFVSGAAGRHIIRWRSDNGPPTVYTSEPSTFTIRDISGKAEYRIEINTPASDILVKVRGTK